MRYRLNSVYNYNERNQFGNSTSFIGNSTGTVWLCMSYYVNTVCVNKVRSHMFHSECLSLIGSVLLHSTLYYAYYHYIHQLFWRQMCSFS